MGIVPTDYNNKATPVDNDSLWGYDSEGVENKNFLFSAIQTYVLNGLTTTDVSEGTNLYYTEARVDANTTVTGKADKTNVIEKDSTTAYTPTLGTHPANKDYVDNAGTNINGLTEEAGVANGDEFIFYDASATANRKIDYNNLIPFAIKSEDIAGIATDRLTSVADVYGQGLIASDTLRQSANTERTHGTSNQTLIKEIRIENYPKGGTIRAKFEGKTSSNVSLDTISIKKNDVLIQSYTGNAGNLTTTYSEKVNDVSVVDGDLIQIYADANDFGTLSIRNFGIYYDEVQYPKLPTITLD